MSHQPIGIFDSGIGGLTVVHEIAKILPQENLVYLGDTARVPYGTKSAETVIRYATQNIALLQKEGVKLVVIACNTASAFALEEVQKKFTLPIIGVIEPGVLGALRSAGTSHPRIGVIGTEGTIRSEAYSRSLLLKNPKTFITSTACPLFVPLVEEGWWETAVTEQIAQTYLTPLLKDQIDVLILGCTHYPLLKKTLQKVVGPKVALVNSAEETAQEVKRLLEKQGLSCTESSSGSKKFLVTDSVERFRKLGELILGDHLDDVEHVEILS